MGNVLGAADVQNELDRVFRNRFMYQKVAAVLADTGHTWWQYKTKIKILTPGGTGLLGLLAFVVAAAAQRYREGR